MYIPHDHPVVLSTMLLSMHCCGSWANTEKADKPVVILSGVTSKPANEDHLKTGQRA